jgi:two-component system phosphate regulon sensor histidine kinase PhoR
MSTRVFNDPVSRPKLWGFFFWPMFGLWILFVLLILYTGSIYFAVLPDPMKTRWMFVGGIAILGGSFLALLISSFMTRTFQHPINQINQFLDELENNPLATIPELEGPDAFHDLARRIRRIYEQRSDTIGELRVELGKLQAVLSGLEEGVLALDSAERIVFANERAVELLQLRQSDPRGARIWELVRHRPLLEACHKSRLTGAPVRLEVLWNGPPERQLVFHVASLGNVATSELDRGATVIGVHDVSELRRLETLRQEFVANVSHELKTPLAVIKVCVETLLDGAVEDVDGRGHFLKQIEDQGNRLYALIIDLLALARVESGSEVFDFQEIDLAESIADCLERLEARAKARGQTLEVDIQTPKGGTTIWADHESIRQILDNLVDNAIKYTPENGNVKVTLITEGNRLRLAVKDNGIGIPHEDLPRIFERFYRVDRARSREMGGTGLGLSIVKHLVQSMHGTVEAQSEPGLGSTFVVRLPQANLPGKISKTG